MLTRNYTRAWKKDFLIVVGDSVSIEKKLSLRDENIELCASAEYEVDYLLLCVKDENGHYDIYDAFVLKNRVRVQFLFNCDVVIKYQFWSTAALYDWYRTSNYAWHKLPGTGR